MAKALFVVTAYVPNEWNCLLLRKTLRSIHTNHPGAPVIVVDNDSPFSNAATVVTRFHRDSFNTSRILVLHEEKSRGQLDSWAVVDGAIQSARNASAARLYLQLHAAPYSEQWIAALKSIQRVIVLQHSTVLGKPLPPPVPECHVIALSGIAGLDRRRLPGLASAHDAIKYNSSRGVMKWAVDRAEELNISCLTPCRNAATECSNVTYNALVARSAGAWRHSTVPSTQCLDFGTALHSVLSFSMSGWRELASFRLWPRDGVPPLAALRQPREIWYRSSASEVRPTATFPEGRSYACIAHMNQAGIRGMGSNKPAHALLVRRTQVGRASWRQTQLDSFPGCADSSVIHIATPYHGGCMPWQTAASPMCMPIPHHVTAYSGSTPHLHAHSPCAIYVVCTFVCAGVELERLSGILLAHINAKLSGRADHVGHCALPSGYVSKEHGQTWDHPSTNGTYKAQIERCDA